MKADALAPIIAITTAQQQNFSRVNNRYIALVTDFGGVPVMLYSESSPAAAKEILKRVHGLVIIGGQDLDPKVYGQDCKVNYDAFPCGAGRPYHRPIDLKPNRKRDDFELALYEAAILQGLPVFGICRGMQLINVAEGGTLHQEIPPSSVDHCAGDDGFVHHHPIEIAPDSFTYQAMQVERYFTSSIHHQAIDKLGSQLKRAAWAHDNVIEIIERMSDKHFVLGIHGHIEQTRKNLPLFEKVIAGFVARCAAQKCESRPILILARNGEKKISRKLRGLWLLRTSL